MTREEIIELYIKDLESKVEISPARDSRINMLKEELKEALTIPDVGRSTVFIKPKDWNLFQWLYAYVLFTILIVGVTNFFVWVFS